MSSSGSVDDQAVIGQLLVDVCRLVVVADFRFRIARLSGLVPITDSGVVVLCQARASGIVVTGNARGTRSLHGAYVGRGGGHRMMEDDDWCNRDGLARDRGC